MEVTFQSMCGGQLAVQDLFRYLVAIGMTPLRGRVEDVLELVDPKQTGAAKDLEPLRALKM